MLYAPVNAISRAIDNWESVWSRKRPIYLVPCQNSPVSLLLFTVPITKAVMTYKRVTTRLMITTSISLLIINWLRLHPSMIFWRCVLKLYSFVMNIMTRTAGRNTKMEEMNPTVCQASGNVKGLGSMRNMGPMVLSFRLILITFNVKHIVHARIGNSKGYEHQPKGKIFF